MDIEVTKDYFDNPEYVKLTVKQNYKDLEKLNNDLRWQYDNRIAVAGKGLLNPQCDRYFVINSGVIGQTDVTSMHIRNSFGQDTGKYRYIQHAGADYWIK